MPNPAEDGLYRFGFGPAGLKDAAKNNLSASFFHLLTLQQALQNYYFVILFGHVELSQDASIKICFLQIRSIQMLHSMFFTTNGTSKVLETYLRLWLW